MSTEKKYSGNDFAWALRETIRAANGKPVTDAVRTSNDQEFELARSHFAQTGGAADRVINAMIAQAKSGKSRMVVGLHRLPDSKLDQAPSLFIRQPPISLHSDVQTSIQGFEEAHFLFHAGFECYVTLGLHEGALHWIVYTEPN